MTVKPLKTALLAAFLMSATCAYAADAAITIGPPGCKVINSAPVSKETVAWSGACKDGYADGPGKLEWFVGGKLKSRFEGTLKHGLYHGEGYTNVVNGPQYEGNFVADEREGKGVFMSIDQSRYEGNWKASSPDGAGTMTFSTGGRYEGQWKAGKYHGHGKLTFTSGKVLDAEFIEGVASGQRAPEALKAMREYHLKGDYFRGATRTAGKIATGGAVPYHKSYAAMNKEEQRAVRQKYDALHDDDEPPYPLKGIKPMVESFVDFIQRATLDPQANGLLRMNVMIDSGGKPTSFVVFVAPSADMATIASAVVMREKYTPALCSGKPCAMIFPIEFNFGNRD